MMIPRDIARQATDYARWFPVVSVTGPRQSGKSTLVKSLFCDYDYVNLEDEGTFQAVRFSPIDFLRERPHRLVIDEAQRIPELFDAIQVVSDESGEPGQYVLTGSQNFLLMKSISQSLAGRVGLLRLYPLSFREALAAEPQLTPDGFMLRGGYPRMYSAGIPSDVFYQSYVSTYVERDAAGYLAPQSLAPFRSFLGLCAQSAGNLVNVSRLASDAGISRATADSWLSLLEASYLLFRLPPFHANLRKRLTKTSKLYFHDTGLLCHLLGIRTPEQLRDSEFRGAVFENLVVEQVLKRRSNAGEQPALFFYRDDSKIEVDLVDRTDPARPELVEVKVGQSFQVRFARHLAPVGDALGIPEEGRHLVLRGGSSQRMPGFQVWSARDWFLRRESN